MPFLFQFHLPLVFFWGVIHGTSIVWKHLGDTGLDGLWCSSLTGRDSPPCWAQHQDHFPSFFPQALVCGGLLLSAYRINCLCRGMWGSQRSLYFSLATEKKARCHTRLNKLAGSASWLWLFTKEKPNKEGGGIYFSKQHLSKRKNSISSRRGGLTSVTIRKHLQTTTWLKKTTWANKGTVGFLWAFGGWVCSERRAGRDAFMYIPMLKSTCCLRIRE